MTPGWGCVGGSLGVGVPERPKAVGRTHSPGRWTGRSSYGRGAVSGNPSGVRLASTTRVLCTTLGSLDSETPRLSVPPLPPTPPLTKCPCLSQTLLPSKTSVLLHPREVW